MPAGDGVSRYRDTIELHEDGCRLTFTGGVVQQKDGSWRPFMSALYRRLS
jgi:hypothetical protein